MPTTRAKRPRSEPPAASELLGARLFRVSQALLAVRKKGASTDRVHELRSRARRAEVALDALAAELPARFYAKARRLVRKARKKAGLVRDHDVMAAQLRGIRLTGDLARERTAVVRELTRQRVAGARALRAWSAENRQRRLGKLATEADAAATLRRCGPGPAMRAAVDAAGAQLREVRARAGAATGSPEDLHRLRIELKRLRYMLEVVHKLGGAGGLRPAATEVKGLTDICGKANDAILVVQLGSREAALAGEAARRVSAALMERAREIHARRHEQAARAVGRKLDGVLNRCEELLAAEAGGSEPGRDRLYPSPVESRTPRLR